MADNARLNADVVVNIQSDKSNSILGESISGKRIHQIERNTKRILKYLKGAK